jgi:hypothetical protein
MHIEKRAVSRRAPVRWEQAQLFAMLTRDLLRAYVGREDIDLKVFFDLPEYQRFVLGAYACGFVCRDMTPMGEVSYLEMRDMPRSALSSVSFRQLRHFLHTLLRDERWADGYSSPVREALESGALELVATRLETDHSLLEPAVMIDKSEEVPSY